ncbi:Proteoglycan 4 [Exaiptasia diaphana]|nr:Proteoglycan 4 [Exaiptasia diaphana]
MRRTFGILITSLRPRHKSIQARYIKTASLSGRDSPTCGTTWKNACATLPGALQVAENHDVIELDGTGTSLHPYDCKSQPLEISINVNITSSNTSRANISCPMINIKSSDPTTVNFTKITLTNSPIVINDARIVLQEVVVTKSAHYAIRGTYDLLNVTPYATLLESTFKYNEGKMLSFDFGGSPGISRGDAFIIKDTTFKKNNAENTSLLEINLSGIKQYSDLKVCFTNLTMDSNVAFRGVYVFSEVTNMTTRLRVVGKPVAVKYGCVHIEFDGDSTAKVKNLTSINGKTSAILFRFEQQNNTLEVINSTFKGLEAAFGAGVLLESWTCKVRQGIYSCFYDTSEDHEVVARFVNCNFFNNRATNKGGAACIAPDSSFKGNLSFIDCNFRNNFASDEGGHIFVGGSKVETIFQNTILHQTTPYHPDQASDGKNMLCYTNNGKVTMINSTIDSDTRGNIQSLVKIAGLRSFEVEGRMKIICPTGTSVELHNSSFATLLPESRESYFTTVLIWSCKSCGYGLYSPSRGSWSNSESGLHRICYKCPLHGADCGEDENLVATKNWWCSNTSTNDEVSCFHCLEDRCCPMPKGKDLPNPKEYNNCCGNRTGILCGKCKDGFAESWFGSQCEPYDSSSEGIWWFLCSILSLIFSVLIVYSIGGFKGLSCSCEACDCNCNCNCDCDCGCDSSRTTALPDPVKCTHSFVSGYQWLGVIIEESPINIASWPASLVKGTAKVFSASIPFVQGLGVNVWEKTTAPFFVFWISLLFAIIIVYILPFVIKFLCFLWKKIKEKLSCDNTKVEASSTVSPEEGTPSRPQEGTSSRPQEGTSSRPQEGTSSRTSSRPQEGTSSRPEEGTSSRPEEGTSSRSEEGTPSRSEEGTPSRPEEGTPSRPEEGTPSRPEEGTSSPRKVCQILKEILSYLLLPLLSMILKLIIPVKINDKCYNMFAPEGQYSIWKLQSNLSWLCFWDSNGLPLTLLGLGLSALIFYEVLSKLCCKSESSRGAENRKEIQMKTNNSQVSATGADPSTEQLQTDANEQASTSGMQTNNIEVSGIMHDFTQSKRNSKSSTSTDSSNRQSHTSSGNVQGVAVENDASQDDSNSVTTSKKRDDKIEFHRNVWRNFVNGLIAFIGVCVVEPSLKQASIMMCLFAFFVRLYHSSDGPSIKPELKFELFVIALSAFISLFTLGTHKCSGKDFSLACSFHYIRCAVLIFLFLSSIIAIGHCLIVCFIKYMQSESTTKTQADQSSNADQSDQNSADATETDYLLKGQKENTNYKSNEENV